MATNPLTLHDILPAGMSEDNFYMILAAVSAFLIVFIVGRALIERDTLGPRVKALQKRRQELREDALSRKRRDKKQDSRISLMRAVVTRLKLLQKSQTGSLASQLATAGWRSRDAAYVFTFFKLVTPLGFALLSILMLKIDFSNLAGQSWKLLVPLVAAYAGLKLPWLLLVNARNKRYYAIQKALSDTLDLMMICAEAGLSLHASLDRVARELNMSYPEMADELSFTAVEMGFFPDRKKALLNLTERVQLAEVRGIVSVLIQTEKYGTPIAQAMRVLSAEFRTQRMLRAEQKAARLPAIMTVPMILFILPTLFVVVITPALIRVFDTP